MSEPTTEAPSIDPKDLGTPRREDDRSKEKISPRLQSEVHNVTNSLFRRRVNKHNGNTDEIDADPAARKINTSEFYRSLTTENLNEKPGISPKTNQEIANGALKDGNVFTVINGQRVRIVEIVAAGTDALNCRFVVDHGDGAPDTEDATSVMGNITPDQIRQANLLAEKEEILAGLTDDERAVAETYFQMIDPDVTELPETNDKLPKQVEAVAEQNGFITTDAIIDGVSAVFKGNPPEKIMDALSQFDGKTVLDREDLELAMQLLRVDVRHFDSQGSKLVNDIESMTQEVARQRGLGLDVADLEESLTTMRDNLELVRGIAKVWRAKEKAGEDPLGTYINKAVNGELDPQDVQDLRSGNAEGIYSKLEQEARDKLPPNEAEDVIRTLDKFKSGTWTVVKYGSLIAALLAAIPAAAVISGAGMLKQR